MTLKTLKDFDYKNDDYSLIVIKELRQEAIKHMKKYREEQKRLPCHPRQKDWKQASIMLEAQIGWIGYFFGIKQEDLE